MLDGFFGAGGLALRVCESASRYAGCEIDSKAISSFQRLKKRLRRDTRIHVIKGDVYALSAVTTAETVILDPPWGGWQVFLGRRYLVSRRMPRFVNLVEKIIRSGAIVVIILPYHAVIPNKIGKFLIYTSHDIFLNRSVYCRVFAFSLSSAISSR
ncbi:MAG: class I SAM-dependent methyltransferase [Pseudomonadota bacterium]